MMATEQVVNAHILNLYRMINSGLQNIPYNLQMRVLLRPGDLIRPEPFSSFGSYFRVSNTRQASLLPMRSENVAVKWTSGLSAANIDGTDVKLPKVSEKFDVNSGELAHWKVMVLTSGWELEIGQPNENKLFTDRTDVRRLTFGNTTYNYLQGDYAAIPEVFTFEDRTPLKLFAYSLDPDRANYDLIIGAYGFKYTIDRVKSDEYPADKIHPETKLIIRMGSPERI